MGRPLQKDEIPLYSMNPSLPFGIFTIYFLGPFHKRVKRIGEMYIITSIDYLTKLVEENPIDSFTKDVASRFIYENIITRFGCPISLISYQGTLNDTIILLMK